MSIGRSYLMWRADHRLQRSARSNRIPEPSIALFGKNIHSFRTLLLGVLLLDHASFSCGSDQRRVRDERCRVPFGGHRARLPS